MKSKMVKKGVSFLLVAVLTLSTAFETMAADTQGSTAQGDTAQTGTGDITYFDFSASNYYTKENADTFRVSVVRHGSDMRSADVLFRAADFLAQYGTDYVIQGSDGQDLPLKDGISADISDITSNGDFNFDKAGPESTPAGVMADESGTDSAAITDEENGTASEAAANQENGTASEAAADQKNGTDSAAAQESGIVSDTAASEKTETSAVTEVSATSSVQTAGSGTDTKKQGVSTGSSLRDAQTAFLGLDSTEEEQAASDTQTAVGELNSFFEKARGTEGTIHFNEGETEQDITIRLIDNDQPNADKAFMLDLAATNDKALNIAANATTYVAIADDEPAEKQAYTLSGVSELTPDGPKADMTVIRTAGSEYFGTVYVSTVQETAAPGAYDALDNAKISFLPGETEKTFPVTAVDFSEDSSFGIRLEADEDAELSNDYVSIQIKGDVPAQPEPSDPELVGDSNGSTEGITLGQEKTTFTWNNTGWKIVAGNASRGWGSGWWAEDRYSWWTNLVCMENYDESAGKGFRSDKKVDFTGTTMLHEEWQQQGTHSGGHGDYYIFADIVSEGCQDQWGGGVVENATRFDNFAFDSYNIDTSNITGGFYIRVGIQNLGRYWQDDAKGYFGNPFTLTWRKYNFKPVESSQRFYVGDTYTLNDKAENGYTVKNNGAAYNAGTICFKDESGKTVNSFYASAGKTVTAYAVDEKNKSNGIILKSVKLYTSGKAKKAYDVKGTSFTLNQSLISSLRDAGAADDAGGELQLYAEPVWEQEKVQVKFYNTDTADGEFNASHLGSYVAGTTKLTKGTADNNQQRPEYYIGTFPKYSYLSMSMTVENGRAAGGFQISRFNQKEYSIEYQKASFDNDTGTTIAERKDRLTYQVKEDCTIRPLTDHQTMTVMYFPDTMIPDEYVNSENKLKGVISDTRGVTSATDESISDADGKLVINNINSGSTFSFHAVAPEGYYTHWVNMTGDMNYDGTIDENEKQTASQNPEDVNGNELTGTVDQSNPIYYYYFVPNTNISRFKPLKGHISKSLKTFYQMVNGITNNAVEPVSGSTVRISGFEGSTDAAGAFSITARALPKDGYSSLSVVEYGHTFTTGTWIQKSTDVILPAINSAFTARSVSAYYNNQNKNDICNTLVNIRDKNLTLKLSVEGNGSLNPTAARFIVYNAKGESTGTILAASAAEGDNAQGTHSVTYAKSASNLDAAVTFNPKAMMSDCDRLYVEFGVPVVQDVLDENGNKTGTQTVTDWYPPVDVGYIFNKELELSDFVLGSIGSTGLAGAYNKTVDLIGNPLGDLDLGTALGMNLTTNGEGSGNLDNRIGKNWTRYSYSLNYSKEFGDTWGTTTGSDGKTVPKVEEAAKKAEQNKTTEKASGNTPSNAKFDTEGDFTWSVSPSVRFEFEVSKDTGSTTGKYYFEDLLLSVNVDFNAQNSTTINLPIGIGIVIEAGLTGNVKGVYYMYTDYTQSYGNSVEFDPKTFGMFKNIDNVHRRGYIGIYPEITIGLGIKVAIISVVGECTFAFNMDFAFSDEESPRTYGSLTISGDWSIRLLSFTIYKKDLGNKEIHLFGEDKEISLSDILVGDEAPVSLDNVSERPQVSTDNWDPGLAGENGDEASVIEEHTTDTPQTQIVPLGSSGDLLMVYVDDAGNIKNAGPRLAVNARAVCYSIYRAADGTWSTPEIIDDDHTLDDYPNICAIGDKYLVTWSSAHEVLKEDAGVDEALMNLDIESAVFDPAARTFGTAAYLTHRTDQDIAADVYPYASYDAATNRILLTYTKNEYQFSDSPTLAEIGGSYSALAYFYGTLDSGKNTVTWNTADDYTETEISNIAKNFDVDTYKANWYGQRFLDIQLYDSNKQVATVTDMSGYYDEKNSQALIAYTVDWDGNNSTADDRDVFMLIYDYGKNIFTHNVRISGEAGAYANPKFATLDGDVYLFYGSSAASGNSENPDAGAVMYMDVSEQIQNNNYTLAGSEPNTYYVFSQAADYTKADGTYTSLDHTPVNASEAVPVTNINDFDVVSSDAGIYLVWTEQVTGETDNSVSRQLFAAALPCPTAQAKSEKDDSYTSTENAYAGQAGGWSQPVQLTSKDKAFYTNISAGKIGDKLFITAGRTDNADASTAQLVSVSHVPASMLTLDSLTLSEEYPAAGSTVTVNAAVKNSGLAPTAEGGTVTFKVGGQTVTVTVPAGIPGGSTRNLSAQITLPADLSGSTITAALNGGTPVSMDVPYKTVLVTENPVVDEKSGSDIYTAVLRNNGNRDSGSLTVTVSAKDGTQVGSAAIDNLAAGAAQDVTAKADIPAGAWNINDQGEGTAELTVKVTQDDGTVLDTGTVTAKRIYDAQAISILSGVSGGDGESFSMEVGDVTDLQPGLSGSAAGDAQVVWTASSDPDNLTITGDGNIMAQKNGTYTLTGRILPASDLVADANWDALVPENLIKTVSATVTVGSPTDSTDTSSGTTKPMDTPTPSVTSSPTPSPSESTNSTGGNTSSSTTNPTPSPSGDTNSTGGNSTPFVTQNPKAADSGNTTFVKPSNPVTLAPGSNFPTSGNTTSAKASNITESARTTNIGSGTFSTHSNPQTGDDVLLWIWIFAVSGSCLAILEIERRRRVKTRNSR